MDFVIPKEQRSRIEELPDGLVVTITNPYRSRSIIKLSVHLLEWLGGLLVSILFISFIFDEPWGRFPADEFIAWLWIGVLVVNGAISIVPLVWETFGVEQIGVQEYSITLSRQVLWWRHRQRYSAGSIQNLRVFSKLPLWTERPYWNWQPWMAQYGVLAFDYGAQTVHFGGRIDEAEGRQILALILRRFPQYTTAQSEQPNKISSLQG